MFESKEENLTPIGQMGEFGFIEHVTKDFPSTNDRVLKGVGDDAAVYDLGNGNVQLVSTDFLVEGIHFDLAYVPLQHLGYKSITVNLSDIYAMNGKPYGVTVSVAMSNRFTLEAMEAFYSGVKFACEKYGVELLGGDTSSSRSGLVVSVTALGEVEKNSVVYRNGAKENDLICVTGDLGSAYAGLQILEREKSVFKANPDVQPDLAGFEYAVGRQLKPEARKDTIANLRANGILPTSMIDISDGLASELFHICKASEVGAQIYQETIPIDYETSSIGEDLNIAPMTYALNGGEDYELLFTAPLDQHQKLKDMADIKIIGHITDKSEGVSMVNNIGQSVLLEAQGWNHFNKAE